MSRKNKLMKLTMLITVALAVAIYADSMVHGISILWNWKRKLSEI